MAQETTTEGRAERVREWVGYGWFMTLGTLLPLAAFLAGYLVHVTILGEPIAWRIYRFGIWLSTLGQEPPGKDMIEGKAGSEKKPFVERIRPYSPPGFVERHGKPVPMPVRVVWFVLVGWWLGVIWVVLSWSLFLLPYPLLDTVAALLHEIPSVMTLAWPSAAGPSPGT
jgi:uncharacterized membrane protein YccF (DUF307 family)